MRNFRITFLIVGCLFVFGIYALARIPKQEFPEYTIRQGVVVGVYPGATAEEVEEQLAKPLEQFLMTYKEVKRAKTTSTSQNGMCYVMVELNDDVNDKDEVWSKVKHGLAAFKMQLPAGVAAVVTNDDFGDTSALLITLESDTRSYRELKGYMDDLSDRLRRIESVSNLRPYGVQQEQISVYADPERLAAYGIGEKTLSAALAAQGLTPLGGSVSNAETETPIHIAPSLAGEREVAEQIVWSDPEGHVLRVKDVARVVREYDDPDSYIRNNGHRCVLLSLEMQAGNNIVEYGREVDEVLHAFIEEELPADVSVQRIADQAEELETRQDIAGRYDQIIADQRQAIATAQKTAAAAEIDRDAHAAKATELKGQLEQMKAEDDATELRLKAALDAVEAREASSRETGNRLVRRLEDSKRIRDKVKAERDTGVAAARQTADATRAQLETLRREYAELQRNPSANPANYTVRTSELSMQISDAADALRKAEEDIPRVTADLEHSLAAAEQAVEQAQAPIADAKRAHQAVTTEADAARDELQTAKTAAATRQRELREKIAAEDKARRDQEQTIANAQADAAHAQSIIEQATEVHDHPEITESLAGSLARDKAEHAETEREVAQLEATEDDVRERTRDSRIKFTGAIVCIVAAILAIILVWLFASK